MSGTPWIIRTDLPFQEEQAADGSQSDPLLAFLLSKTDLSNFASFNEIGKANEKEHQHTIAYLPTDKKDTVSKWLTKALPQLKSSRKGQGGDCKYSISKYDPACPQPYDEFRQDYVCKEGRHRCGTLWTNENSNNYHSTSTDNPLPASTTTPEFLARKDRREKWLKENAITDSKKKKIEKAKEKTDPVREYLEKKGLDTFCISPDPRNPNESPRVNEKLLKAELIKYYQINANRPRNRSVARVIAENYLFFAPIVCPRDKDAHQDLVKAIDKEIEKMCYG